MKIDILKLILKKDGLQTHPYCRQTKNHESRTIIPAFTLIETLIVVTILSVSLLIGTSLVITSLKAAEKNKNRFIAT